MSVSWIRQGSDLPAWSDALLSADPGEEWVVVHRDYDMGLRVEITCAMLLDAGLPARLHPEPFAGKWQGQFLWGDMFPIRLLVPASRAADARALLAGAFDDADGEFTVAAAEIAQARADGGWYTWVPHAFRAGVAIVFVLTALTAAV